MGPGSAVAPPQEGPQASDRLDSLEARRKLTSGERFPREARLARASDIRRCLNRGRRRRSIDLEMIWTDNSTGHARLGLIIPRFRHSAVARNRVRRRLKEIWRREVRPVQPDWDLVVRARRSAYEASFEALRSQLLEWRDRTIPATS